MSKKKIFQRGEKVKLSKNFHLREFECKCMKCPTTIVDLDHVKRLQALREKLGKPLFITSAYRCPDHNKNVGGSPHSQHLTGTATDIVCRDISPDELADICESYFNGLGRYNTFTHIDSRSTKARWDVRTKPEKQEEKKEEKPKPKAKKKTKKKTARKKKQLLPDGPSKEDIKDKFKKIEDEILGDILKK